VVSALTQNTMANDFKPRIRNVLSAVFGVPSAAVTDASSPDTVEGWDSLNHIHLILALEMEFGVSFEADQALALTSIPSIEQMIHRLGGS